METNKLTAQPQAQAPAEPEIIYLEPSKGWISLELGEVWKYRELLFFLAWRDIRVRYKQTIVGIGWAVIQPLTSMVVFSLIFGGLAQIPSDGLPYPIFSYAALVPWTFFANSLNQTSVSMVGSGQLIKKVYFPRLVIPLATVLSAVVDFVLAFGVLLLMMLVMGIVPTTNVIWLPFFLLLAMMTALGTGLWLAALNTMFRDVRYITPFLVQMLLYISPIVYPSSMIENDTLRLVYGLNPMAGVVEGFRWALLGTETAPGPILLASGLIALVLLLSGLFFFRRVEKTFADVI